MEQEPPHAFWMRNILAGLGVRLDVGVIKKGLAFLDAHERVADIRFAGADRFDLAAFQLNAGFVAFENMKIAQRLAIEDRLGGHESRFPTRREIKTWRRRRQASPASIRR